MAEASETPAPAKLDTRALLREIRQNLDANPTNTDAHVEWLRTRVQGYTKGQLEDLDAQIQSMADAPDLFKSATHKEVVTRVVRDQLSALRGDVKAGGFRLTQRDFIPAAVTVVGAGYLGWKFLGLFKKGAAKEWWTDFKKAPLRSVGRGITNTLVGTVTVFFGAAFVERWLQDVGKKKIDQAKEAARPLGNVASGETVRDDAISPVDTTTLKVQVPAEPAKVAEDIIGLPPKQSVEERTEEQEEGDLQKKLAEAREKRGTFTLVDAYRLQMLYENKYADRVLKEAAGKPTPKQEKLILAARMRASYSETLGNALSKYSDLYKEYEKVKALCKDQNVTPGAEAALGIDAMHRTLGELSAKRLEVGFGTAGDPEKIAQIEKQLWDTLKVGEVKPGEEYPVLPVFAESLELLNRRYQVLLARANSEIPPECASAETVIDSMNKGVVAWFQKNGHPGLSEKLSKREFILRPHPEGRDELPADSSWDFELPTIKLEGSNVPLLRQILLPSKERDYTGLKLSQEGMRKLFTRIFPAKEGAYEEYTKYAKYFESRAEAIIRFKTEGSQNLGAFSRMQSSMAQFQIERAKLAIVQNRAGRKLRSDGGDGPDIWTGIDRLMPDKVKEQYDDFFMAQQKDATGRLEKHLSLVENNVLKVGLAENFEHGWNKKGRKTLVWFAHLVAEIETGWMPENFATALPQGEQFFDILRHPRKEIKKVLMGELPNLLGWPKYKDGEKKHDGKSATAGDLKDWEDFTLEESKAIEDKQVSVVDCIKKFKEAGTEDGKSKAYFERMKESVALVKSLGDPANKAEVEAALSAVAGQGELTIPASMQGMRVTSMEDIRTQSGGDPEKKAQLILLAFGQLLDDNLAYQKAYGEMLEGFHAVIGDHIDWGDAFREFGMKQTEILLLWLAIMFGVAVVGVVSIFRRGRWVIGKACSIVTYPVRAAYRSLTASRPRPSGTPLVKGRPPRPPIAKAPPPRSPVAKAPPPLPVQRLAERPVGKELARQWDEIAEGLKNARNPAAVQDVLRAGRQKGLFQLSEKAIENIGKSPGAIKVMQGAAKVSGTGKSAVELERAVKAANAASKTGVVWKSVGAAANVAGAALDVYAIVMAVQGYLEYGEKIKETENEALREIYRDAQTVKIVEGGVAATGLIIGGVAFFASLASGSTILTALAAPAGTVMLPVGVAVVAGGWYHGELTAGAETFSKNVKDRMKEPPAHLLSEFNRLGTTDLTWGEMAAGPTNLNNNFDPQNNEARLELLKEALAGTRGVLLQAYLAQHVEMYCPRQDKEADEAYSRRTSEFVNKQVAYLLFTGGKENTTIDDNSLRNARLHARVCAEIAEIEAQRAAGKEVNEPEFQVMDGNDGFRSVKLSDYLKLPYKYDNATGLPQRSWFLAAYADRQHEAYLARFALLRDKAVGESGETDQKKLEGLQQALQQVLLGEMQDAVNKAEANMTKRPEDQNKNCVRYLLSCRLRDELNRSASRLLALGEKATALDYRTALSDLRASLQLPVNTHTREIEGWETFVAQGKAEAESRSALDWTVPEENNKNGLTLLQPFRLQKHLRGMFDPGQETAFLDNLAVPAPLEVDGDIRLVFTVPGSQQQAFDRGILERWEEVTQRRTKLTADLQAFATRKREAPKPENWLEAVRQATDIKAIANREIARKELAEAHRQGTLRALNDSRLVKNLELQVQEDDERLLAMTTTDGYRLTYAIASGALRARYPIPQADGRFGIGAKVAALAKQPRPATELPASDVFGEVQVRLLGRDVEWASDRRVIEAATRSALDGAEERFAFAQRDGLRSCLVEKYTEADGMRYLLTFVYGEGEEQRAFQAGVRCPIGKPVELGERVALADQALVSELFGPTAKGVKPS